MFALTTANALQALISAYTLYICSVAISAARTYEKPTERAAQYLQTAEDQLWQTRTTLASSTLAVALALATSTLPFFGLGTGPQLSVVPALPLVTIAALVAARRYDEGFWTGKPRVPGAKDWNLLMHKSAEVRVMMRYLVVVAGLQIALGVWANLRT